MFCYNEINIENKSFINGWYKCIFPIHDRCVENVGAFDYIIIYSVLITLTGLREHYHNP